MAISIGSRQQKRETDTEAHAEVPYRGEFGVWPISFSRAVRPDCTFADWCGVCIGKTLNLCLSEVLYVTRL